MHKHAGAGAVGPPRIPSSEGSSALDTARNESHIWPGWWNPFLVS
jgi:hypothetical protein